ncbi:MAG: hypothetical protein ACK52I_25530 [Pseudomonadota bacterium]
MKTSSRVPISRIYDAISAMNKLRRRLRMVRSLIRDAETPEPYRLALRHEERSIMSRIETTAYCLGADARDAGGGA